MTRDAFKAANRELIRLKFSLLGVKFATASITGLYLLSAQAITTGSNPYRGIIDRNVFSLKEIPPPPPPPGPDAGKPPPPPITLTGITTILGTKRAFMTLNIPGGKPGEAAKQESLMLTEGQRDGEVEVIRIDEKAKTVLVRNYGSETNLSFDTNGAKSGGSSGATGAVASHMPAPGHNIFSPGFGAKSIPTRNVRLGGSPITPAPVPNSGVNASPFTPGSGNANGLNGMFTPGTQVPQQQQAEQPLTPAQQEVLLEAGYQAALAKKDPSAAVFPPGILNPTRNVTPAEPPGTGTGNPAAPNPQLNPGLHRPGSF